MSIYLVTGNHNYAGFPPGQVFEAALEPRAEARAIMRGNIKVVEHSTPALQPGTYKLPIGWLLKEEVRDG